MSRLYMLAFEHRGTFRKMIFGTTAPISEAERELLISYKHLIWDGVKKVSDNRGGAELAISVDDEYGEEIHREAHRLGIRNALPIEKSGRLTFEFDHSNWQERLRHIRPTFAKALVRVYPDNEDPDQYKRLADFSHFCREEGFHFLLEPLILPSDAELLELNGDHKRFNLESRPRRFIQAVRHLHEAGIFPDVWKIEGVDSAAAMEACVGAVLSVGNSEPQIIVSGRGGNRVQVENWLRIGARSPLTIGFAIGRTIFEEPLQRLHKGESTPQNASGEIATALDHFIQVFEQAAKKKEEERLSA